MGNFITLEMFLTPFSKSTGIEISPTVVEIPVLSNILPKLPKRNKKRNRKSKDHDYFVSVLQELNNYEVFCWICKLRTSQTINLFFPCFLILYSQSNVNQIKLK